ncbi:uncharacterized protein LAESUDRAFT_765388 [Laetiporus sulphureus 93-53]|uniref:Uncharacterized protein n=1 Tax=Laetiporus sulphureus 93-53 TaxID=1314785 RepID=A0A165ASE2_9APHY|nr:uncharacterized protein LAESUDRAFT_765388 [Laetiporus sulphureus 93-53]KZS99572.1 hypothetical protein LAESUDRAFT_765388 [Laetiporus sulphureus 93-53]
MPRFQDFDIGIAMDSIKCTEFNVDVDFDAAITTCYIESIIGKNFVCDFMNHSEDTDFAIKPTFDGAKLRPFFAEAGLKGHKAGLHLNTTFLRPFEFAPTLIIEDSTTNRTMPSDNGIGTLTFEIWRVKSVHRRDMDENQRGSKRRRTEDGSVVTAERVEPERREGDLHRLLPPFRTRDS